ncbi:MAG TPA: hypothetical protein VIP11_16640 [Gemmatimonadaceae bacterium]
MSPNRAADLPEGIAELKSTTAQALRMAVTSDRRAWYEIERIVREYVRALRGHGMKSERAVAETKALVVQATGDPLSSLLTSAVTWALSEYYER